MVKKNIRATSTARMINVRDMKNALKNEPVFLIGNGPSVNDEDLSSLRGYFTLGLNRAYLKLDPTILFWQDNHFWKTESENIKKTKAIKICRDISDPQNNFYHYRLKVCDTFRLPEAPQLLFGCGATGPLAFQFAYALGCDPIVLIGFDCKYREKQTDFYGVNKHHKPCTLLNCTRGLEWIHNLTISKKIINCSDNNVFPTREKVTDVIKKLGKPGKNREFYTNSLLQRI